MTKKMMKIFLLVLAFAMIVFISAAAYAEEAAPVINEEDLVEIDDDWGYISREAL